MNNIREARMHRGLSQTELGKLVGLSASTIGMIEQGRRSPSLRTITKIAEALDCSVNYLMEQPERKRRLLPDGRVEIIERVGKNSVHIEKIYPTPPIFKMLIMDDPELAEIVNATKVVGEHDVISHGKLISISPAKLELFHAALKAILEIGG